MEFSNVSATTIKKNFGGAPNLVMGYLAILFFAIALAMGSRGFKGLNTYSQMVDAKAGSGIRCKSFEEFFGMSAVGRTHCLPPASDHSAVGQKPGSFAPAFCLIASGAKIGGYCEERDQ